jgi:hypothetical protein
MELPARRTPKRTKQTTKTTKRTKPPTITQQKILDAKQSNPGLTVREIGKLADCSHVNVITTLRRYGIDSAELQDYKSNRADILSGIQNRIIKSVTDEDIKKMPIGQRIMSYGILYDKERLERGQATSITDDMNSIIDRIEKRYAKAIDVTPSNTSD